MIKCKRSVVELEEEVILMKKNYERPEWEMITFSPEDMRMVSTGCSENCSDDCSRCYYLVCQPEDVIIGG